MDFRSVVSKATKVGMDAVQTVAEQVQERAQRIEKYKERFGPMDDRTLIQKYRSTSGEEKMACAMLLKERGLLNSSDD